MLIYEIVFNVAVMPQQSLFMLHWVNVYASAVILTHLFAVSSGRELFHNAIQSV